MHCVHACVPEDRAHLMLAAQCARSVQTAALQEGGHEAGQEDDDEGRGGALAHSELVMQERIAVAGGGHWVGRRPLLRRCRCTLA